jgi:hypothetical protein
MVDMGIKMQFWDFEFALRHNGDITFDEGLTPDQLNVKDGDVFKVMIVDGRIILKKQENGS